VQLNNTQLQSSVSGIAVYSMDGEGGPSAAVTTGSIDNSSIDNSRGVIITNNNTGVASISNSQSFNINNSPSN
jgi:hypothetical protein